MVKTDILNPGCMMKIAWGHFPITDVWGSACRDSDFVGLNAMWTGVYIFKLHSGPDIQPELRIGEQKISTGPPAFFTWF